MNRRNSIGPRAAGLLAIFLTLATTEQAWAQADVTRSTVAESALSPPQSNATPATSSSSFVAPLGPAGGTQWSLYSGFGINQVINKSAGEIDIVTAGVRWSHMWSAKGGGVFRGHPGFAIELVPVTAFLAPGRTTWAVGANIMYEHHFAVGGRVLPIWKLGAGALQADHPVPEGETRFNFTVLTALGIDVMITETKALFFGYRFHHVSNANIGDVNPGINAHTAVFGISFYR